MISEIWINIVTLLSLVGKEDVLWIVLPLLLATIIMLTYFEKYKDEKPGWNTHVANSLVLVFVSIILLRHVFLLGGGIESYLLYPDKSIISLVLFALGLVILLLNFNHIFPEKIANKINSPLTVNIVAFVVILRVFSNLDCSWITALSSVILLGVLLFVLHIIKIPIYRFFRRMQKLKEKEPLEDIKEEKKKLMRKKREVREAEKKLRKDREREADRNKKQAIKLKKEIKKPASRRKKKKKRRKKS